MVGKQAKPNMKPAQPNLRIATPPNPSQPEYIRALRELRGVMSTDFGFVFDLWGAQKVARASSSGLVLRICRCLGAKARQTRRVWLPSTRLFPQIRDEPNFTTKFTKSTKDDCSLKRPTLESVKTSMLLSAILILTGSSLRTSASLRLCVENPACYRRAVRIQRRGAGNAEGRRGRYQDKARKKSRSSSVRMKIAG